MACRSPGSRKGRGLREPVRLRAESLAFGGDAVARDADGRVVLVPLVAPGDLALVKLTEEKKGFARGELVRVLEPGPARVVPPCPLFGRCGGCQWQHVDYPAQVAAKGEVVARALRAEVARGAVLEPPLAAPAPYGYRRRARLAVRPGGVMGFRARRSHEVVDVAACPALEPVLERALAALRAGLGPLLARACTLHLGLEADGVHAALDVPAEGARAAAEALVAAGALAGVAFSDGLVGSRGAADEFAQAQEAQNQVLCARVAEWARPAGARVLELYAGAGNLTEALLAAGAAEVLAVEEAGPAVERARARLGAAPVRFETARAEDAAARAGDFDVVVLDPPRTGALEVARALTDLAGPARIVYVSCDPMTLARDIAVLTAGAWRLERAQAIDMMPQTFHVETVALLTRAVGV